VSQRAEFYLYLVLTIGTAALAFGLPMLAISIVKIIWITTVCWWLVVSVALFRLRKKALRLLLLWALIVAPVANFWAAWLIHCMPGSCV